MKDPDKNDSELTSNEDEISAQKVDPKDTEIPANDGLKTSKNSQGLTWQGPADEQANEEGGA